MDRYYNCDDNGIIYRNAINLTPDLYKISQLSYALEALIDVEEHVETIDTINTETDWGLFKNELKIIRGELKGIENNIKIVLEDFQKDIKINLNL